MSHDHIFTSVPSVKYKMWPCIAIKKEHWDRLEHLWFAGIKSVQKLVKMTGHDRSTISKKIKKLKDRDDLKLSLEVDVNAFLKETIGAEFHKLL